MMFPIYICTVNSFLKNDDVWLNLLMPQKCWLLFTELTTEFTQLVKNYTYIIFHVEIAYSYQKFCDWDLKLLQATQHQGSHDRQISGLPVVAAWTVNFETVALLFWLLYAITIGTNYSKIFIN